MSLENQRFYMSGQAPNEMGQGNTVDNADQATSPEPDQDPISDQIERKVKSLVDASASLQHWDEIPRGILTIGVIFMIEDVRKNHGENFMTVNPLEERDRYFAFDRKKIGRRKLANDIRSAICAAGISNSSAGIILGNVFTNTLEMMKNGRLTTSGGNTSRHKSLSADNSQAITSTSPENLIIRKIGHGGLRF